MDIDYYTQMSVITLLDNLEHTYFSYIAWEKDHNGVIGTATLIFPYTPQIYNYWTKYDNVVIISASMEKGKGTNTQEYADSITSIKQNIKKAKVAPQTKFLNNKRIINEEYNYSFIGHVRDVKPRGEKLVLYLEDIGWKFLQYVPKEFRDNYIKGKYLDEAFQSICEFLDVEFAYSIEKLHEYQFADDGFSVQQNGQVIETVPSLLYEWSSSRDITSQGIPNSITEGEEQQPTNFINELGDDIKSIASGVTNGLNQIITNATEMTIPQTSDDIQAKVDKYQEEFDMKITDLFVGNTFYESDLCSNVMDYGRITQEGVATNPIQMIEAENEQEIL